MVKNTNRLDTSPEFYIHRYHQGIKLITPDNNEQSIYGNMNLTVKAALQLPFCVYFLNKNSIKQSLNDYSVNACGFTSIKHGIGKSVADVLIDSSSKSLMKNDHDVVTSSKVKIVEELALHKNNTRIEVLTIKMPWYNMNNEIIGVFGFSAIYGVHSIPQFLTHMLELNFFKNNQYLPWACIKDKYLTKRECEVLKHTIRGFSAYEVGQYINLSQRTVEYHLENIKQKFAVSSKSEVINMVIEHLTNNLSP